MAGKPDLLVRLESQTYESYAPEQKTFRSGAIYGYHFLEPSPDSRRPMDSHPLFDERVVDLLRGVTDDSSNSSPQASRRSTSSYVPALRKRNRNDADRDVSDAAAAADWTVRIRRRCRPSVAVAWVATGHRCRRSSTVTAAMRTAIGR